MMMSPKTYANEHKNDSFEEIIEMRNDLVDELKDLEKIVFDKEKKDDEWSICPGPDVQYQMTLEYLAEVCVMLGEKYNKEYEN